MSFSWISSRFRGVLWIIGPSFILVQCFRGKVVIFIARSYFSSIFWIFRSLFELDLLLLLTQNPQKELCVIIAIIQDMYTKIVGSYKIKIKNFNLFIIRNHFSLQLLLSIHSSSQVKPTNVLFPLPPHGSLTLEPPTT